MVSVIYQKAISEVLEYLKGINNNYIEKIPKEFINFLENNKSEAYHPQIDYTKPLSELNLSFTACSIISYICYEFWCEDESKKRIFMDVLIRNQELYEKEFNNKIQYRFNEEDRKIKEETDKSCLPIETKKEIWIFIKIKSILKKIKEKFRRR